MLEQELQWQTIPVGQLHDIVLRLLLNLQLVKKSAVKGSVR